MRPLWGEPCATHMYHPLLPVHTACVCPCTYTVLSCLLSWDFITAPVSTHVFSTSTTKPLHKVTYATPTRIFSECLLYDVIARLHKQGVQTRLGTGKHVQFGYYAPLTYCMLLFRRQLRLRLGSVAALCPHLMFENENISLFHQMSVLVHSLAWFTMWVDYSQVYCCHVLQCSTFRCHCIAAAGCCTAVV